MNEQIRISDTTFVGVFDSGLGGISVLSELVRTMPYMDFEYFGDSANAPYGVKELDFVISRAEEICGDFVYRGAGAIVIACNTATSAAAARLRAKYTIPIIGMEPAVKPALAYLDQKRVEQKHDTESSSDGLLEGRVLVEERVGAIDNTIDNTIDNAIDNAIDKKIAVLATPMTLKEKKYKQLVETLQAEGHVIEIPSPELVELVENHFFDEAKVRKIISAYVRTRIDSRSDIGAIVLGCTHFVFLKKYFEEYCEGLRIFDGNEGTARRLLGFFPPESVSEQRKGSVRILNSAGPEKVELSKKLLRYELDKEEYFFVKEKMQEFIEQMLTGEEANLAKYYFLDKMTISEISEKMKKREKALKEEVEEIRSKLFRYLKKQV